MHGEPDRTAIDFITRAKARMREMDETAEEITSSLGLPVDAKPAMFEAMYGSEEPEMAHVPVGGVAITVGQTFRRLSTPTDSLAVQASSSEQHRASLTDEYQSIIDEVLQLVYSQHYRIMSRLYPAAIAEVSLEQLREGPLGEELSRLAQVAGGALRPEREEVLGAIDSVLLLLFWPVGADTYTVPRSFWETPLGKMLSFAKYRAFEPNELISIGQAANHLNVTRPTIYRWMDDKTLDYVRDMKGRTFVVREDVEAMKAAIEAEAGFNE